MVLLKGRLWTSSCMAWSCWRRLLSTRGPSKELPKLISYIFFTQSRGEGCRWWRARGSTAHSVHFPINCPAVNYTPLTNVKSKQAWSVLTATNWKSSLLTNCLISARSKNLGLWKKIRRAFRFSLSIQKLQLNEKIKLHAFDLETKFQMFGFSSSSEILSELWCKVNWGHKSTTAN